MPDHPIPEEGELWWIDYHSATCMELSLVDPGGEPVLVLPCTEHGETPLHELLREARDVVHRIAPPKLGKHGGPLIRVAATYQDGTTNSMTHDAASKCCRLVDDITARIDADLGGKHD